MTEETDGTTSTEEMTIPVPFKGREIHMRMPTPEQLLVWQRTMKQFENMNAAGMNAHQALNAIDRCVRIITSLFVQPKDREWLDDGLLDQEIKLNDLLPLMSDTIEAFRAVVQESGNREERRAAAKVVRKAPAKTTPVVRKAPARKAAPVNIATATPKRTR